MSTVLEKLKMDCHSHHGPLGPDGWYPLLFSDSGFFSATFTMASMSARAALRIAGVIHVKSGVQAR